jgi:hypothetical protein
VTLDLNSPESIAAWFRVCPPRHGPQLAFFMELWPQFVESIKRAGEILRAEKREGSDGNG